MKINIENHEKIEAAIEKVQTSHMSARLVDVEDIIYTAERAQKYLDTILYRKDQACISFGVDVHAQSFPGAYKGNPSSTQFILTKGRTGWFLANIWRGTCRSPKVGILTNLSDYASDMVKFAEDNMSDLVDL